MKSNNSRILIVSLVTILSFLSVTYISCSKDNKDPFCYNHACLNGGFCKSGKCTCANGFEDSVCSTPIVNKFLGKWTVTQKVVGSNDKPTRDAAPDSTYIVIIDTTSTPTTFFINYFMGDVHNTKIVCYVDSTGRNFSIQRYSNIYNASYNYYLIGGVGSIVSDSVLSGTYNNSYTNSSGATQLDTCSLRLVKLK